MKHTELGKYLENLIQQICAYGQEKYQIIFNQKTN